MQPAPPQAAPVCFVKQRLVAQLLSAFCSSACENFAAIFGSHSLSEAVLFLSLQLLWLIGSGHSSRPPFKTKPYRIEL